MDGVFYMSKGYTTRLMIRRPKYEKADNLQDHFAVCRLKKLLSAEVFGFWLMSGPEIGFGGKESGWKESYVLSIGVDSVEGEGADCAGSVRLFVAEGEGADCVGSEGDDDLDRDDGCCCSSRAHWGVPVEAS